MNGALAVGRYTLVELSRRRILLVFFILGAVGIVLLGVGLKVLYTFASSQGSFAAPNTDPAALNRYLELAFVNYVFSALGVFGLLIAFAIGMTAIYHDLESGAAVSIFAKPVSRFAFAAGKIAGAAEKGNDSSLLRRVFRLRYHGPTPACFSMSSFGPLQKFSRTLAAC